MEEFEHLDHYELLGVSRGSSEEEIKRGYRQQISRFHPDRYVNRSAEEEEYASRRTKHINEAYRILSDPSSRTAYDRGWPSTLKSRRRPTSTADGFDSSFPKQKDRGKGSDHQQEYYSHDHTPHNQRDHQAELYDQSVAHLAEKRYVQAVATLQELQRINPFYRDSASLLARAEAAHQKELEQKRGGRGAQLLRRFGLYRLVGGVVAIVGIVAVLAIFIVPQFRSTNARTSVVDENTTPTATPFATMAASSSSMVVAGGGATGEPPVIDTPTMLIPTTPITPTEAPPTAVIIEPTPVPSPATAPSPTVVPTAVPTPIPPASPTPAPSPTAVPEPEPNTANPEQQGGFITQYTFNGGEGWANNLKSDWGVGPQQGQYVIYAKAGIGNIWSYRTISYQNYSVGVDVQVESGVAGLAPRFADDNNYLTFFINPQNGSYRLESTVAGSPTTIAEGYSEFIYGGRNRIVAQAEGSSYRFYVNKGLVLERQVASIPVAKQFGLVVVGRAGFARSYFDNVQLRTLY
jgi:curved DNA-binding protein CbpA